MVTNIHLHKQNPDDDSSVNVWGIVKDSLRSSAISALILGLVPGIVTEPVAIYEGFYEPLFRALSILLLIMGMEAYQRLHEMKRVAHWFALYAFVAPIAHGLIAFGLGYLAHIWTGFSPGVWFYFRSSPHPTATFQGRPLCGPPYRAQTRQPTLAPVPGRYSGSDRYLHPTIYRAGPSGLCLGDTL